MWKANDSVNDSKKEGWYYLAVKLSILLRGITSKHHGDCLNCLHSFRTEIKLNFYVKVCKNEDFCGIVMPWRRIIYLNLNNIW